MKFEVKREEFMKAVTECTSLIESLKAKDKKGENVKLSAKDNGIKLEMVYGNGMMAVKVPAIVHTPGEILIDSSFLVRTGWKDESVKFWLSENRLAYKCGPLKGEYALETGFDDFEALRPMMSKLKKDQKFTLDTEALRELLSYVQYEPSLSQDSNPSIMAILSNNNITLRNTDTFGGAHAEQKASNKNIDSAITFTVLGSVLEPALAPFKDEDGVVKAVLSKKALAFTNNRARVLIPLSRALVGNIRSWLDKNVTQKPLCIIQVMSKDFLDAVNGVRSLVGTDAKNQVAVKITPSAQSKKLVLNTKQNYGESKFDLEVTGLSLRKEGSFAVNANLFNRFFKCFGTKTPITLKVYTKVIHLVIDRAEYLFPTNIK